MVDAINQPKSSREEAAAAERSKREAELAAMAALRRPAGGSEQKQSRGGGGGADRSTQTAAAEAARKKRDAEIEELRRLKAAENEETRRRLQERGGTLTTDMDAWRSEQLDAKDRDRRNKLEARNKLTEHHAVDSDAAWRAEQMEAKERDRRNKLEAQNLLKGHRGYYEAKKTDSVATSSTGQAQQENYASGAENMALEDNDEDDVVTTNKVERVIGRLSLNVGNEQNLESNAILPPSANVNGKSNTDFDEEKEELSAIPADEVTELIEEPSPAAAEVEVISVSPTYTRHDIKFSFGLIVRSSAAAEDFGNKENLRDNETLRKCMESTSKILVELMPSMPNGSTNFPDAYYNPKLEPTVISIEEDEKTDATSTDNDATTLTEKGNKRTLVKASFPVFIRDQTIDDEGKQESTRMLKETKNTVFKALRAAVSGGSFLKL